MSFHEMDDALWQVIQPYLPPPKPHVGRPRADERGLFNEVIPKLSFIRYITEIGPFHRRDGGYDQFWDNLNGILYVLSTGCTWHDVPRQYGTRSTVHRFHLYLCHHGIYDEIFAAMRQHDYDLADLDLSCCAIDTTTIPAKKGD